MGEKKVTIMVLKVDLKCPCCYKKVKKLLCRYPQIQNQVFDEKANTVTITVVCCSPEKIRDKLCCKGGKTIKSIEIVEPPKPKPPEKPKPRQPEQPAQPEKPEKPERPARPGNPKGPEKPEKPKPADRPSQPAPKPPPEPAPKPPKPAPPKTPEPAGSPCIPTPGYPPPQIYPVGVCCGPCYEGMPGGPCYQGYGRPVPGYDCYGNGPCGCYRPCYASRCDYFSEENATGCTIM
ncbi:hypothetical protein NMG60_11009978 [Bertholletia excelsa]